DGRRVKPIVFVNLYKGLQDVRIRLCCCTMIQINHWWLLLSNRKSCLERQLPFNCPIAFLSSSFESFSVRQALLALQQYQLLRAPCYNVFDGKRALLATV